MFKSLFFFAICLAAIFGIFVCSSCQHSSHHCSLDQQTFQRRPGRHSSPLLVQVKYMWRCGTSEQSIRGRGAVEMLATFAYRM